VTEIIPARKDHLDALEEIEKACFSTPWSRDQILSGILSDDSYCLIALYDSAPSGYALARGVLDEAEILKLAVLPRERGKGIGRGLVLKLLEVLRDTGVGKVFLECRESNTPAIVLYETTGFRNAGRRRGYYSSPQEDAVMLKRDL
jgi:ribosomal-protein-alanine N-acetyltransferase